MNNTLCDGSGSGVMTGDSYGSGSGDGIMC